MSPVENGSIHVDDIGAGDPPVVCVHGDWTDSSVWMPLSRQLRTRVITYDQRGYGASPRPAGPYTWAGDLRAVLDATGIRRAVLVGHSGGAGIAAGLAATAPDLVAALVLVAPGTEDYPWPADDPFIAEAGRLSAAGDQEALVELGLRTWARAGHDTGQTRQLFRRAVSAQVAQRGLRRVGSKCYALLDQIRCPVKVIVGDLEYPMVTQSTTDIAARIPGASVVTISGADHLLPLQVPAELAETIGDAASE